MKEMKFSLWALALLAAGISVSEAQVKVRVNPLSRRMVTVDTPNRRVEVQPTRAKVDVTPTETVATSGPVITQGPVVSEATTGPLILPASEEMVVAEGNELVEVPTTADKSTVTVHKMQDGTTVPSSPNSDANPTPMPPPRMQTNAPSGPPQPIHVESPASVLVHPAPQPGPMYTAPQPGPMYAPTAPQPPMNMGQMGQPYGNPYAGPTEVVYPTAPPPTVVYRPGNEVIEGPTELVQEVPVRIKGDRLRGPTKLYPVRHHYTGATFFIQIPCLPIEDIDDDGRDLEIEFDDGEIEIRFHRDGSATVDYDF